MAHARLMRCSYGPIKASVQHYDAPVIYRDMHFRVWGATESDTSVTYRDMHFKISGTAVVAICRAAPRAVTEGFVYYTLPTPCLHL